MDSNEPLTIFINKVPQTNSSENYLLKSEWDADDIHLQIFDGQSLDEWKADISMGDLRQAAKELEIPFDDFYKECKEAITSNGGVNSFHYKVADGKFTLVKNEEFQIQYLEVNINPTQGQLNELSFKSADIMAGLRNDLMKLQNEAQKLGEEHQRILDALEKCIQEKNDIEGKLLQRFVVLLNSKKDKIAELQDLLVEKNQRLDQSILSKSRANEEIPEENRTLPHASDDNDDDFTAPTQIMTQVKSLPKRKKLEEDDFVGIRRRRPHVETIAEQEDTPANDVCSSQPEITNIFDDL